MHHHRVRRGGGDPLRRQLVAPRVLRLGGQQRAANSLALDAQRHHGVGAHDRPIQIGLAGDIGQRQRVLALLTAARQRGRQQRARRDQRHLRAQPRQRPDVGARHPRMRHIAHDHHPPTVQPPERRLQDVSVKQRLGRVRVLSVAGVDHVRIDRLRDEIRRAGGGVADDHHIRTHGGNRFDRVDQRLALFDAGAAGADVDHVRAQHLAGQLERGAGARAGLVEEIADRHPAQRRRTRHGAIQNLPHRLSRLQHMLNLGPLQTVHIEQMTMPPGLRVGRHLRRHALRFGQRRGQLLGQLLGDHPQRPPSVRRPSGSGCSDTPSASSTSISRTRTSSPRRVGTFLPT